MNLLIGLFLIVFEALSEGLAIRGYKPLAGIIEFIYRLAIALLVFFTPLMLWMADYWSFKDYWYILFGYVLLRYALFDYIFNLAAGLQMFYYGSTKIYDKLWGWFLKMTKFPPSQFLFITKLICLFIGIVWMLK